MSEGCRIEEGEDGTRGREDVSGLVEIKPDGRTVEIIGEAPASPAPHDTLREVMMAFWRLYGPALDYCSCGRISENGGETWEKQECICCRLRTALAAQVTPREDELREAVGSLTIGDWNTIKRARYEAYMETVLFSEELKAGNEALLAALSPREGAAQQEEESDG